MSKTRRALGMWVLTLLVCGQTALGGDVTLQALELGELPLLRQRALAAAGDRAAAKLVAAADDKFELALRQGGRDLEGTLAESEGLYRRAILRATERDLRRRIEQGLVDEPNKALTLLERAARPDLAAAKFLRVIGELDVLLAAGTAHPDLTVQLWDDPHQALKWLVPYPPIAGQPAVVQVLIRNVGIVAVEKDFSAELYVDGTLASTWSYASQIAGEDPAHATLSLLPGESLSFDHTVTLAAGKHEFRWVVDSKKDIQESDESLNSNELQASFEWRGQGDLADLVVQKVAPQSPPLVGQQTTWNVEIKNAGKLDVNTPFWTTLEVDGVQIGAFQLTHLAKGASQTFGSTQHSAFAGQQTFVAVVDTGNTVPEADETNNSLQQDYSTEYVDLAVQDVTVSPQSVMVTEPVKIAFTVVNNGPGEAWKPFKVWVIPGMVNAGATQPVLLTVDKSRLPLKQGGKVKLEHTFKPHYVTTHNVGIQVDFPDPDYVYTEKDKSNNNRYSDSFAVTAPNIKIAKAEPHNSCLNDYRVTLDRSGPFWKGDTVLRLVHQGKVLDTETIKAGSDHAVIGVGHLDPDTAVEGKYNWQAEVAIAAYGKVSGQLLKSLGPDRKIQVRQYGQLRLRSMEPQWGKPGTAVVVEFGGAGLLRPDKSAGISVFWKNTTDPNVQVAIQSTQVVNSYTDRVRALFTIDSGAPLGARSVHVGNCAHWFKTVTFTVGEKPSPPPPSGQTSPPPPPPKKPDIQPHEVWIEPSNNPSPNTALTFYFTGFNVGTADMPESQALLVLKGSGKNESKKIKIKKLTPGAGFKGSWSFSSGLPKGSYAIDVYLDYDFGVSELNEYNNQNRMTFSVW